MYLIFDNTNIENFASTDEAIKNVASVYNASNMQVINLNVTESLKTKNLEATTFNLIPRGVIVAFNGGGAPAGWVICDGQNGTPDLRGKFILSSSNGYNLSQTGGEKEVTLTVDTMPRHGHNWGFGCNENGGSRLKGARDGYQSSNPCNWGRTSDEGGGKAHNNMPPYYVLAYIMKT